MARLTGISRRLAGVSRRRFLQTIGATALAAGMRSHAIAADETQALPPVRQITRGPKFHWFSYYDKHQFDATDRYVLSMQVDFEHRSPRADDVVRLGMIDLKDNDKWIELDRSTAWCWQQGCMLQWLPGARDEIIWNDREKDRYVCRIMNVKTRAKRTIPHPVYSVSPDGRWAVTPDFRRLGDTRPGYGYNGIPDPNSDVPQPKDTGIFRVDLVTGRQDMLFSVADIAKIPSAQGDLSQAKHWFNHLLVNTDGTRFEFLNRWSQPGTKRFVTRMFTAAPDGSKLHVIDDNGLTSHFIWRDPRHILAFSGCQKPVGFYLFEDKPNGGRVELIGKDVMKGDGHCSYLPKQDWVLCDTYPDRNRRQNVYLYHIPTARQVWLGHFESPKEYTGEWRCDTHPRSSRDGRSVVVDSPHGGQGRQLFLIDVSRIVG